MMQWIYRVAFLCVAISAPQVFAGNITGSLDRTDIAKGETVNFVIEAQGKAPSGEPDLTPLKNAFSIDGVSTSQRTEIINGKTKSSTRYIVMISPQKSGAVILPAIHWGDAATAPVTLQVKEASEAQKHGDFFLENTVSSKNPYVQSEVVYTSRLWMAAPLSEGTVSMPKMEGGSILPLGDEKRYETQRQGKSYVVSERRYALFPDKAGKTIVYSPVMSGIALDPHSADDMFFGMNGKRVRVVGSDVTLQAKPEVAGHSWWLPAKSVSIQAHWQTDPPVFKVGEPITRRFVIRAVGAEGATIPPLSFTAPEGVAVYPGSPVQKSEVEGDQVIGSRVWQVAYVPSHAGDFTLPAIAVHWWNISTHQWENATVDALPLHVLGVPTPIVSSPVSSVVSVPSPAHTGWFYGFWVVLFGWLSTLGWGYWVRRRASPWLSFKRACGENNPRAAEAALSRLIDLNAPPVGVEAAVRGLREACYGKSVVFDGKACYQLFKAGWKSRSSKKQGLKSPGGSLYPD